MTETCEMCKHWERYSEEDAWFECPPNAGECQLAFAGKIAAGNGHYGKLERANVKFYAQDRALVTTSDFGCNQFEAKQ